MNTRSRTKNSITNLIAGLGSQLILTIVKFVNRTVFIKTLGASYLGINGLFSDILTMLSISELGIDTAIIYMLYKPISQNDSKKIQVLLKFYKKAYRIVGIVILALGICIMPLLPLLIKNYESLSLLGINARVLFLLYLIENASSYLFFSYRSAIIRANQRDYVLSLTTSVTTLLKNILQIISLYLWKNFMVFICISLASTIINSFIIGIIAKKDYPYCFRKTDESLSKEEIKDFFKDLGALFIYKIDGVILKATDNIALSSFVGLTAVGLYSNYLIFYTTIKALLQRVYSAVKASAGNLFASEGVEKQYLFFRTMNFITVLLYGTACVGVSVIADEVIKYWIGEKFIIEQPFSILVGIEILLLGIKENLAQIRHVTGTFRQVWYLPLIAIIINAIVSILLVNRIGIHGVIIGTIVANLLTNYLVDPLVIYKRCFLGYKSVREYYTRNALYCIVLLLVGYMDAFLCKTIIFESGLLTIIVHFAICGLSVPTVFLLLWHKSNESIYLKTTLSGLIKRKTC